MRLHAVVAAGLLLGMLGCENKKTEKRQDHPVPKVESLEKKKDEKRENKKGQETQAINDDLSKKDDSKIPTGGKPETSKLNENRKDDPESNLSDGFSNLGAKIDQAFIANSLTEEVEIWWTESMSLQGPGRGYWTQYYAYNKAINVLSIDIENGKLLRKKITSSEVDPKRRNELLRSVDDSLNAMNEVLDEFKLTNWEDRFDLQEKIIQKISMEYKLKSEECEKAVTKVKADSLRVVDRESYDGFEPQFISFIDFIKPCLVKK